MCVCYDTRSSYARANRVAALLLAQLLVRARWLAAAPFAFYFCMCALICCYASCSSFAWQGDLPSTLLALLVHGHTDLLLRHLSFLKELCENVPIIVPLSSAVGRNLPAGLLKNLLETPRSGQFSKVHG